MWIERIDVKGFRALVGLFEFEPGLNLVVGANESGKSTLHDALVRALYGFTAAERRRSRGRSTRDDCQPWDGRPFALSAAVRDAGGHDYRVEWDFEAHRVRLLEGARDRSGEVQLMRDEVRLGELLLGVGPEDFRQVCCLDQDSLEAVRTSPSLGLALQEAVAQIGGDVAAQEVIDRLEGFLREHVGVRVDTLAPTPRGRITALLRDRDRIVGELHDEEGARQEIATIAVGLDRNREEYREMTVKIERTRQRLLLSEYEELAQRLDEARSLDAEAAVELDGPPPPAKPTVDEIHAGQVRLDQLDEAIGTLERRVAGAADEIERLETTERELEGRVTDLDSYVSVDVSARDAVQRSWGELEAVERTNVPEAEPESKPDPALARYRAERPRLYELQAGGASWTWRRILWTALVVLTLGLALLVRKLIRKLRGQSAATGELEQRLAAYGASSLAELDERLADEDQRLANARARAELATAQGSERAQRLTELENELAKILDEAGAAEAPAIDARVAAYLQACARHSERVDADLQLERAKNELQRLRQPRNELRARQSERDAVVHDLRELYRRLGIDADDLDAATAELEVLVSAADAAALARQQAEAAAKARNALLADLTLAELAAQVDAGRRALNEHVARVGSLASSAGDRAELRNELAELEQEAGDTRDRLTEAQTQLAALEERLGRSPELEERKAELDEVIGRLEQAKDAIGIARDVLREAADELHRQFQPHLRDALTRNLPRITGGRYHEAEIDNELQVSVIAPGVGRQVGVDQLSRATKDQIFLVERLEIARLLAPRTGSAPLLLDDPFAHCDAKRLRFALTLLRETADERQVIIFSEDAELPALATSLYGDCRVIELPEPIVRQAVGVDVAAPG